jgi:DNA mismatch repair ATPase MutS
MQQDVLAAEQQVAAAAAAALDGVAETFLGSYGVFRSLVAAVADLDVLAGFAHVSLLLPSGDPSEESFDLACRVHHCC